MNAPPTAAAVTDGDDLSNVRQLRRLPIAQSAPTRAREVPKDQPQRHDGGGPPWTEMIPAITAIWTTITLWAVPWLAGFAAEAPFIHVRDEWARHAEASHWQQMWTPLRYIRYAYGAAHTAYACTLDLRRWATRSPVGGLVTIAIAWALWHYLSPYLPIEVSLR